MEGLFSPRKRSNANVPDTIDTMAYAKTMNVDPEQEPGLYRFLCHALACPLPEPWTEHSDRKGRVFYWNPLSSHSSWKHPLASSHQALIASYRRVMQADDIEAAVVAEIDAFHRKGEEELGLWRESVAEDGTPYYYKVNTQMTRWDNPRDSLLSHMELRVRMLSQLLERSDEFQASSLKGDPYSEPVSPILDTGGVSSTPVKTLAPLSESVPAVQRQAPMALTDGLTSSPAAKKSPAHAQLGSSATSSLPMMGGTAQSFASAGFAESQVGYGASQASASSAAPTHHSIDSTDNRQVQTGESQAQARLGLSQSLGASGRSVESLGGRSQGSLGHTGRSLPAGAQEDVMGQSMGLGSSTRSKGGASGRQTPFSQTGEAILHASQASSPGRGSPARVESPLGPLPLRQSTPPAYSLGRSVFASPDPVEIPGTHTAEETRVVQKALAEATAAAVAESGKKPSIEPQSPGGKMNFMDHDELAALLKIDWDSAQDRAAFAILRPLFAMPLPAPWQILRQENKRYVYYHPGVREVRIQHPLFSFYVEVLDFLRTHAQTKVPITEPLSVQVFKEASPGELRRRLGVWQGPLVDEERPSGERFSRLVAGKDDACLDVDTRPDDPRVEAADNVMARLAAWRHLWMGFAKDEVFPYATDRLRALSTQLSESVVVVPGAAAEALLAHMIGKVKVETPRVLTEEEQAVQAQVVDSLGFAYGRALESMENGMISPHGSRHMFSPMSHSSLRPDTLAEGVEGEEEATEKDESDADEEVEVMVVEVPARDPSPARSQLSHHDNYMEPLDLGKTEEEAPPEERPKTPEPIIVQPFLGLHLKSASEWAAEALRPRTPTGTTPRAPDDPELHESFMGKSLTRFTHEDRIWEPNHLVRTTIVKPWLNSLGWRLMKNIGELQWDTMQADSPRVEPLQAEDIHKPPERIEEALKSLLVDGELPFAVATALKQRKDAEDAAEAEALAEAARKEGETAEAQKLREAAAKATMLNKEDASSSASATNIEAPASDAHPAIDTSACGELEVEGGGEDPGPALEAPTEPIAERQVEERPRHEFVAPPGSPSAMRETRDKIHGVADTMRRTLNTSAQYFDRAVADKSFSSNWRTSLDDDPRLSPRHGRNKLKRASAIVAPVGTEGDSGSTDVKPVAGQVACPPSPNKGTHPVPPHLAAALAPAQPAVDVKRRPASAGPKQYFEPPNQMPPSFYDRPLSANARARPSARAQARRTIGQMTRAEKAAAEITCNSIKRFLSRTCGTVEAAMNRLDSSGLGQLTRQDWADGLTKLGYEGMGDVQEAFTAFDKRGHYILTLSDLQDSWDGVEQRPLGLQGIANQVLMDSVNEAVEDVVTDALRELLEDAFLCPSGGPYGKSAQTVECLQKIRLDLAKAATETATTSPAKGKKGGVKEGAGKKTKRGSEVVRTRSSSGHNHQSLVEPGSSSAEEGQTKRSSKTKAKSKSKPKKGAAKDVTRRPSPGKGSGSPARSSSSRSRSESVGSRRTSGSASPKPTRAGRAHRNVRPDSRQSNRSAGSGGRNFGVCSTIPEVRQKGSRKKQQKHGGKAHKREPGPTPSRVDNDVDEEVLDDEVESEDPTPPAERRRQEAAARRALRPAPVAPAKKFAVGYNFSEDESEAVSREALLPWVPRPAEEICKTYGHIFRLLRDPRVRKPERPSKRSMNVSVSVPQLRKATPSEMQEDAYADRAMPLPTAIATKSSKGWHAKSSPDLHTKFSAVSTTAGSGWNPYATESSDLDPGTYTGGLELPPLGSDKPSSAPTKQRPQQLGRSSGPGRAAAGIDAGSRLRSVKGK